MITKLSYDSSSVKGFDEFEVNEEIQRILELEQTERGLTSEEMAEAMAFAFMEDSKDKELRWDTYFGPFAIFNNGDGTVNVSPSLSLVTPEMISYWEKRADESVNPMLKARYSGLVWDFKKKVCSGERASYQIGRVYIESLIEIANGDYHKYPHSTFIKLERALSLACGFNDSTLVENCKNAIINFERKHAQDSLGGTWGYSFDLLVSNPKVSLSVHEEKGIIDELESRLSRLSGLSATLEKVDPWGAEAAAKSLAEYYRKKGDTEQVRRVIMAVVQAFEKITSDGSALQVSGWYDHLYQLLTDYKLMDEAEKILIKLRDIGPMSTSELTTFSYEVEVPVELRNHIESITTGNLETALLKIVGNFCPRKEDEMKGLLLQAKENPMLYLSNHTLQDEKGRIYAKIGSIQDDIEGQLIRHISQNLSFSSIYLNLVIKRSVEKIGLNTAEVLRFLDETPIIEKDRFEILKKGLEAYFNGDFIGALHLLIPQIENAIRNIVDLAGGNVQKQSRNGGYHLKTFDEILRDNFVLDCLGEDLAVYFRILFTDQRGWNLRNNVCHGICDPKHFNQQTANRVFHALLCLGLVRKAS